MNRTEKATYLRIALALQNISVHQIIAEQIIETFEAVNEKGGDLNLHDAVEIQVKYSEKQKTETP